MKRKPTVSAVLVHPLVQVLAGAPAALAAFFGATDLTPELILDADARVSPAQFCVAWAEAVRLTGDPQLALRIAEGTQPGAFGVVEYLCRAAPHVGEALRQWVRFLNLLDDAVVVDLILETRTASSGRAPGRLLGEGPGRVGQLRVVAESEAPVPAAHELCFALVTATIRRSVAVAFRPDAVEFSHRLQGDLSAYERFFGAPVRFGAAKTQLTLSQAALDTPLIGADPGLLAVLTRHAEGLCATDRGPPLTTEVRRVLATALQTDDAQVDRVARRLGMTARTLQRRLVDEGTSFLALREVVRRSLAARYLEQDFSLSEVAYLLGFSEPSAFFRAFKRWTGQTPLEARASRHGALAPA